MSRIEDDKFSMRSELATMKDRRHTPGRRPLTEGQQSVRMYVKVPASLYDEVYHFSRQEPYDGNLSRVVRVAIERLMTTDCVRTK